MLQALANSFRIGELRHRILVTLALIGIYRIGCYIPSPGVNGQALAEFFDRMARTQGGTLFAVMDLFSGAALSQCTIFALGIMPVISASIIMHLLTIVLPNLEKLGK